MNVAKIYTDHTRSIKISEELPQQTKDELSKQQNEAISKQAKNQWLEQQATQDFVKSISVEIKRLTESATNLAYNYHTHNNHQQIIKLLIEAKTLEKLLIETYA